MSHLIFFKNRWVRLTAIFPFVAAMLSAADLVGSAAAEENSRAVAVPTKADTVQVIRALPDGGSGSALRGVPSFRSESQTVKSQTVTVELSGEPVWIVEGTMPADSGLSPWDSPFGMHPASVQNSDYSYAKEIGVAWDRTPEYMLWFHGQPDVTRDLYVWDGYDEYFKALPSTINPIRNITVVFDGMVQVPGRKQRSDRPREDISNHLAGTSYLPRDVDAYSRWVKAVVERYDGDGISDMPGLKSPNKYWQVDNEPPRGRSGYPELVRITANAVKSADPKAKVILGGLMMPTGNFLEIYEKSALPILRELNGKYIDIIDFHWFGEAGEWKLFPDLMKRVRSDLASAGFGNTTVWITEMGTYSGQPQARPNKRYQRQSERVQASELVKRYAVSLGAGVSKVFWAWGMIEGFINTGDNDFFDNTGLIYDGIGAGDPGKGIKKISYWSYQKMTELLCSWDAGIPEKVDLGPGAAAYRFKYKDGGGKGVIIAWLDSEAANTEQIIPRINREEPRRETIKPRRRPRFLNR